MATRIRTLNFLPEIFKTASNSQFLAATLDQLVAQPNTQKIQGYIGSKFGYGVNAKDYYVTEPTKTRTDYQLDPGVVFLKENDTTAKDFISYPGIIDTLKLQVFPAGLAVLSSDNKSGEADAEVEVNDLNATLEEDIKGFGKGEKLDFTATPSSKNIIPG